LILGTLDEIREYAYKANAEAQQPKLPIYKFENDRQHWAYVNFVDTGWPIKWFLEFVQGARNAVLLGPSTLWVADPSHQLVIEAAYDGPATKAKVYVRPHSAAGYTEENSLTFDLQPGGKFTTYRIPLNAIPQYNGAMTGL